MADSEILKEIGFNMSQKYLAMLILTAAMGQIF
jgi:hypothetical protein